MDHENLEVWRHTGPELGLELDVAVRAIPRLEQRRQSRSKPPDTPLDSLSEALRCQALEQVKGFRPDAQVSLPLLSVSLFSVSLLSVPLLLRSRNSSSCFCRVTTHAI